MAVTDISHLCMVQVGLHSSLAMDMLELPCAPLGNWVLSLFLMGFLSGRLSPVSGLFL